MSSFAQDRFPLLHSLNIESQARRNEHITDERVVLTPSQFPVSILPGSGPSSQPPPKKAKEGSLDRAFLLRFRALIHILQPYTALWLVILSVIDAYLTSKVGNMIGLFYMSLVDQDKGLFIKTLTRAAFTYVFSALSAATSSWLAEYLGVQWRGTLTAHMHRLYLSGSRFYSLQLASRKVQAEGGGALEQRTTELPHPASGGGAAAAPSQTLSDTRDVHVGSDGSSVDNPDQRIAQDCPILCDELGQVAKIALAAPLSVLYYSYLTFLQTGLLGVFMAFAFFFVGAALQRPLVSMVGSLVFRQERLEGDFRVHHVRVRTRAEAVAVLGAEGAERAEADSRLAAALANKRRVVGRRWMLALLTKYLEYAGAILNYAIVAVPVFSGAWSSPSEGSGGQVAMKVSQASFATLSLVYGLTQIFDLSDKMTYVAGLLSRVFQLEETLGALDPLPMQHSDATDTGPTGPTSPTGPSTLAPPEGVRRTARPVLLPLPWGSLRGVDGPVSDKDNDKEKMEVSIHSVSDMASPHEEFSLAAVFPSAPRSAGPLTLITTIQGARIDLITTQDPAAVAAEMDRLLETFFRVFRGAADALVRQGFWCDAVDPRTGAALQGPTGGRFGEPMWAHRALGYPLRDAGVCPLLDHPTFGTACYPATIATSAPPEAAAAAIAHALELSTFPSSLSPDPLRTADGGGAAASASVRHRAEGGAAAPVLSVRGLTVSDPKGHTLVSGLSFDVRPREVVLLAGPNGAGKSTVLRALQSLHPREQGTVRFTPAPSDVVFVPQDPLLGPGRTLRSQLEYPNTPGGEGGPAEGDGEGIVGLGLSLGGLLPGPAVAPPAAQIALRFNAEEMKQALIDVGLSSLLDRAGGCLDVALCDAGLPLSDVLSPGEVQRLCFARMLLRRPTLAILDEPFSSVSQEDLPLLMDALRATGAAALVVGHGGVLPGAVDATVKVA